MRETTPLTPELHQYIVDHSMAGDAVVTDLVAETRAALPDQAGMQVGPEQGPLLHLLVRLIGASNVIEIGTFTGMSSLWMARALPDGGRLLCLDVSDEYTAIARRAWERAGVDDRIELRLGPAIDGLRALERVPSFDLAFVDADKEGYPAYLDELVPRLRPGGLLVADNVLWSGRVVDESDTRDSTVAIRQFNDHAATHPQLQTVMLPISDGMTLSRRIS